MNDQTATNGDEPDDEPTPWWGTRARQDTLDVRAGCNHTRSREPRIDEGASDSFADDRNTRDAGDAGEQVALAGEQVGDGQIDLSGDTATTSDPDWSN